MSFQTPFAYIHQPGQPGLAQSGKAPLLLLHGTGGTEHDLLGLAQAVAPGRALLSPRGRVLENGMPRFFRRFAEGKFDEDDIRLRATELAGFITSATAHHGLGKPIGLGFSNGANMAAALLALNPGMLAGAVLLRAMAPFRSMPEAALPGTAVLLSSGTADTMIPKPESDRLAAWLTASGAALTHKTFPTGHGLVQADVTAMTDFLSAQE